MDLENEFSALADKWSTFDKTKFPEILWHYTDVRGGIGIIENKELWATSFQHLNDPKEFEYGIDIVIGALKNFSWSFQTNHAPLIENFIKHCVDESKKPLLHFFICSLSADFDSGHQWKMYAAKGIGMSLGFSSQNLPLGEFIRLLPVEYEKVAQENLAKKLLQDFDTLIVKHLTSNSSLNATQIRIIFDKLWRSIYLLSTRLKHKDWCNEKEWRLVVFEQDANLKFRSRGDDVVPFTVVNLQPGLKSLIKLLLGPKLLEEDVTAAEMLKSTRGLFCEVIKSQATIL